MSARPHGRPLLSFLREGIYKLMIIMIDWIPLATQTTYVLEYSRVLYAYVSLKHRTIYYIGETYYGSVKGRWACQSKDRCLGRLALIGVDSFQILVGDVHGGGIRLSEQLLKDVESLLILSIKPVGNKANTRSRTYCRPGMVVKCSGHWPLRRKTYRDR